MHEGGWRNSPCEVAHGMPKEDVYEKLSFEEATHAKVHKKESEEGTHAKVLANVPEETNNATLLTGCTKESPNPKKLLM